MPSEEEKNQILEAQMSNPDIPLGSAENFLLTMGSISDLEQRLKLWAFTLEYDTIEGVNTLIRLFIGSILQSVGGLLSPQPRRLCNAQNNYAIYI